MPYDLIHIFISIFAQRMASVSSLKNKVEKLEERVKILEVLNAVRDKRD